MARLVLLGGGSGGRRGRRGDAGAAGRPVEPERIVVRLVRVGSRGDKRGRCETVRELYGDPAVGRPSVVSHVGDHPRLERSMTTHDFATSGKSRGDLDALSLGLTELLLTAAPQRAAYLIESDF